MPPTRRRRRPTPAPTRGTNRATPSWKRPDSALSPSQLKNRQRIRLRKRQDADPLYQPGAPLTGSRLAGAVDRIVEGQFAPVERGYRQEITDRTRQGGALQGRARDYYTQLAAQEQRGVQTQAALGNMLSTQLSTVGSNAAQAAAAATSAEQQRLASDAAVRGAGLQDTSTLKETAVLGANAQENQATALRGAAQGTSTWANFANALSQARGLRGGEVQERLGNRTLNANLRTEADLRDLATRRGGAQTDTLLKLRQQGFENLATSQTLNLKGQEAATEAQESRTQAQLDRDRLRETRRATDARIGATVRGQDISASQRAADRASRESTAAASRRARARTGGTDAGTSPTDRRNARKLRGDVNTAASDASALRGSQIPVLGPDGKPDPSGRKRRLTDREIRANLRKRYKDRDVANAAMDMAVLGYMSPTNERRLKARGITIPREWLRRRPRRRPRTAVDVAADRSASGVSRRPPVPLG